MSGAELLSIGNSKVEGYYTRTDMAQEIVFNGDEKPLQIEMIRFGEDSPSTIELTPKRGILRQAPDLPLIGVSPRLTPVIGKLGAIDGSAAESADPAFEPGDRIVKVNEHVIENDIDLRRALALDADRTATFVLEREKEGKGKEVTTTTLTTTIPKKSNANAWLCRPVETCGRDQTGIACRKSRHQDRRRNPDDQRGTTWQSFDVGPAYDSNCP